MDEGTFYLIAAYVLVSVILQALRLAALHEIGRRLGALAVQQERVIELLEERDDLDIDVVLEEEEREYASTA